MTKPDYQIKTTYHNSARLDDELSYKTFDNLILHDSYENLLHRMIDFKNTGNHCFTITGPYGGGKSTFGLLLSGLFSANMDVKKSAEKLLPKTSLEKFKKSFQYDNGLVVIKIISGGDNLINSLHNALLHAISDFWGNKIPKEISNLKKPRTQNGLLNQFELVARHTSKKKSGLIIIFDELGKVFENAQKNNTDIYIFQELGERFDRLENTLFVGILHQAFQEYAKNTSQAVRDEWAKIQGRFKDLPFFLGTEETVKLINNAILGNEYPDIKKVCTKTVESLEDARLKNINDLDVELTGCWPLHPMTTLLLGPISKRGFSQNERSTFGFLMSNQPYGFSHFLLTRKNNQPYTPDALWDYLKHNVEPTIIVSPDGHKWAEASVSIKRIEDKDADVHVKVLKVIAMINLFGKPYGLVANRDTLKLIFKELSLQVLDNILEDLKVWSVIVYKKHLLSYAIFAGSDIDLESHIRKFESAIDLKSENYFDKHESEDYVVAKRHYHEKGTLRWLDKRLCSSSNLQEAMENNSGLKGEFSSFILSADKIDDPKKYRKSRNVVGYAKNIDNLKFALRDLEILEYAEKNIAELAGDDVARKELNSRIDYAISNLNSIMDDCFDNARWFFRGEELDKNYNLSQIASEVAEKIYNKAPTILNETINKDKPASGGKSALKKLLYAIVSSPLNPIENQNYNNELEKLGIEKDPPELSLYLSLIKSENIHKLNKETNIWEFVKPTSRHLKGMWNAADEFLMSCVSNEPLSKLYEIWKKPPYGIKQGVLPIYALLFMLVNERRAGFYLQGIYQPKLNDIFVDYLAHSPNHISIRYFDSTGVKKSLLKLYANLSKDFFGGNLEEDVLKVAKPFAKFVHNLPNFTKETKSLSERTQKIRNVILKANDPIQLIEKDLQRACGLSNSQKPNNKMMDNLDKSLDELRVCYGKLIDRLRRAIFEELNLKDDQALSKRAQEIRDANTVTDIKFKRLIGILSEPINDWVSRFASTLISKNPKVWADANEKSFYVELHEFAREFKIAEDIARDKKIKLSPSDIKRIENLKLEIDNLLGDNSIKIQEKALIDILAKMRN